MALYLKKTRKPELVLSQSNYTLLDDVLYHVEPDKTLHIIPPKSDRKKLWEELHSGCCGGHLKCAKSQLSKHYWWPGMRTDIVSWCRGCIVCAKRNIGRSVKTSHPFPWKDLLTELVLM